MTHWAAQYIGIPWVRGGEGPHAYSCWGFFRHVQASRYGRSIPTIAVDPDDAAALVNLFSAHPEGRHWAAVDHPNDGDAVVIHQPLHVGLWLDYDGGGVLHCARGRGVIFTHDSAWASSGFGRRQYRRHIA